ncbi:MAG: hypothetical protein KGJ07_01505, partial [Patescibacteria group bacterium]|nr:hypothetical protein [Patescibacteria group bacterium]
GIGHLSFTVHREYVPIDTAPITSRFLTLPFEFVSYLGILLYPKQLYVYRDEVITAASDPRFYLTLPVMLAVITLAVFTLWKHKNTYTFFFFLWLVVAGGVISNIIPLDTTIAERWLYGLLVPLLLFVGSVIGSIKKKVWVGILTGIAFLFVIAGSLRTIVREGNFASEALLFAHDIQFEKSSYALYNEYAVLQLKNQQYTAAVSALNASIALYPGQSEAYDNLGIAYYSLGQKNKAAAMFQTAVAHAAISKDNKPYDNYAQFLLLTGNPYALQFTLHALTIFPQSPKLNTIAAQLYHQKGDETKAQEYLNKAQGN